MFVGPTLTIIGLVFTIKGHWGALIAVGIGLAITKWHLDHPPKYKPALTGRPQRKALTETVRHEVWRRDQGKCVECGSRTNLEFDHILPVSKGGSNSVRNVELRCETCNRRKGAKV